MEFLRDQDTSLEALSGKTVAILGYGNQGRAQALNLRDSGATVIVGNREDEYKQHAIDDGFAPMTILEAAKAGDFLLVLTTDECQPGIWDDQILPGLAPGKLCCWASGYNVGYDLITPPAGVDVVMVAPRMTGNYVRKLYEDGRGAFAQFAVHQDGSGQARERTLALCKGMGLTRGGVFEASFRVEAEMDLFAEQVIWSGLTAWFLHCFELGVKHGFDPELMVVELYASGEASEILGMMAKNGFFRQMANHSTTSQYGTLSRGRQMIPESMKEMAEKLFLTDIRNGAFVKEWTEEQAAGAGKLDALKEQAFAHPMTLAENEVLRKLREMGSLYGEE